jgi:hypothetical protein
MFVGLVETALAHKKKVAAQSPPPTDARPQGQYVSDAAAPPELADIPSATFLSDDV